MAKKKEKKKDSSSTVSEDVEQLKLLYFAGGKVKMGQLLWKTV